MIENTVLNYLKNKLDVDVKTEKINASTFVLIEKTGGGEKDHLKNATLAIQSYAPSLYEAAVLNKSVKVAMQNLPELDDICKCELNSDYNYTDLSTKRYRYQAVFDIIYY